MNTKNKILTLTTLTSAAAAFTALLNKYIKHSASSKNFLGNSQAHIFKWRFGQVYYTKEGSGKPLLLIHDFHLAASGYEWHLAVKLLKKHYTVYTIDLLGFGRSEKPNLTYTNYLYVQLLSDFIRTEIGHRTSAVTTGSSASIAVMACSINPDLFDKLAFINPDPFSVCSQFCGKNAKLYKLILDLPIIGTLLYHIASSRELLTQKFVQDFFCSPSSLKPAWIDAYYEAAHLGECPKAVFASAECCYTRCNIVPALRKIDNSINILGGAQEPNIKRTIQEYREINPAVEYALISRAKHLPQLEQPEQLVKQLLILLD